MKFTHFLTKEIIISRMTAVSGDKIAMTTVTACMAQLQPLSDEKTQIMGGVFGKTFKIYVDTSIAINVGDRLRDENNNYYTVKKGGVTPRSQGSIDYQLIIIEQTN